MRFSQDAKRALLSLVLSMLALVITAITVAAFGTSLHGCTMTAVQQQATTADIAARAFNRALPLWQEVESRELMAAANSGSSEAAANAALEVVIARWAPVHVAWETAKLSHGRWRAELNRCQALTQDGGACPADSLEAYATRFAADLLAWRCVVHEISPASDPFPGAPECSATRDAGVIDDD